MSYLVGTLIVGWLKSFLFQYFGHDNVSVLDGGLQRWKSQGYTTTDQTESIKVNHLNHMFIIFVNILGTFSNPKGRMKLTRSYMYINNRSTFGVVTAKLISSFVFATRIVQCLFFLNPKSQTSNLLL